MNAQRESEGVEFDTFKIWLFPVDRKNLLYLIQRYEERMEKIMKQLVFLSILLQSRNKVALKSNQRTKVDAVRNRYLTEQRQRQHG